MRFCHITLISQSESSDSLIGVLSSVIEGGDSGRFLDEEAEGDTGGGDAEGEEEEGSVSRVTSSPSSLITRRDRPLFFTFPAFSTTATGAAAVGGEGTPSSSSFSACLLTLAGAGDGSESVLPLFVALLLLLFRFPSSSGFSIGGNNVFGSYVMSCKSCCTRVSYRAVLRCKIEWCSYEKCAITRSCSILALGV